MNQFVDKGNKETRDGEVVPAAIRRVAKDRDGSLPDRGRKQAGSIVAQARQRRGVLVQLDGKIILDGELAEIAVGAAVEERQRGVLPIPFRNAARDGNLAAGEASRKQVGFGKRGIQRRLTTIAEKVEDAAAPVEKGLQSRAVGFADAGDVTEDKEIDRVEIGGDAEGERGCRLESGTGGPRRRDSASRGERLFCRSSPR